jgi:SAM-dependent methyltransferase
MKESEINTLVDNIAERVEELERKRKWYQSVEIGDVRTIPDSDIRALTRTDSVLKFIPQILELKDRVLDVGCNAGLHSLTAAQYCGEVVGVDVSEEFIEQAHFLKSVWEKETDYTSKVSFKVSNVLEELETLKHFNVIFALKVLYHPGFVKGIHNFMSIIENSEVRAILAQGHVTQPNYGTIEGMKELFDQYGFNTVVLENIPEYPIVFALRKGEKLSDRVTPVTGVRRNIEYYEDHALEDNVRCKTCIAGLNEEKLDFDEYREVFERCFVEVGIMRGTLGTVRQVPLTQTSQDETNFALKMGVNRHSSARVESALEFFNLFEKHGEEEFLDKRLYRQTEYWLTTYERRETFLSRLLKTTERKDKKWVIALLQMYKNMRVIRDLVPKSQEKEVEYSVYYPDDFPWSIDYFGYIKKRDGSHRRMIMRYFGTEAIDEIVVDFDKITVDDLDESMSYLKGNFEWFHNEVLNARKELTPE